MFIMTSGRYQVAPATLEYAVVLGVTFTVGTYGLQKTTSTLSVNLTYFVLCSLNL